MKKLSFIAVCSIVISIGCSTNTETRKVMIVGRGKITAKDNKVSMTDGSGYTEETVDINEDKAVTWNVTTPSGATTVDIPGGSGFYVLNLKTDTLVGSQQNLGSDLNGRTMTQEELKSKIDSLQKLTTGANVSPGGNNFIVLPNQLIKISGNSNAKVFGPFNKIPASIDTEKNGKAPEVYKFYTNTEMRDLIVRLKKNTI